jgi:hypothetical protein
VHVSRARDACPCGGQIDRTVDGVTYPRSGPSLPRSPAELDDTQSPARSQLDVHRPPQTS